MADQPVPARRTQAERSASTRGLILSAAIECLVRLGYGATTTVEVARAAGVSRGAMLHHFPTKRDLMFAVTERAMDLNHEYFMTAMNEVKDPWDRYAMLPDMRWQLALQPHGIALTEILVGARSDEAVRDFLPEFRVALYAKQYQRLVDRAQDADLPVTAKDRAVSMAIVFAIRGMASEIQIDPSFDTEPVLQVLRELKLQTMESQHSQKS